MSRSWVSGRAGHDALLGERDGGGLDRADPDRQIAVARGLLQQDDRLVGRELDSDTDHGELDHSETPLRSCERLPKTYTGDARASPDQSPADQPPSAGRSPDRTRVACSRTDRLASSRATSSARPRASGLRCRTSGATTCLDQSDLALGRGPEGPQVARLEPEPAHRRDRLGDHQRVAVVVARRLRASTRPKPSIWPRAVRVEPGGVDQLLAGQPQLGGLRQEVLRARQAGHLDQAPAGPRAASVPLAAGCRPRSMASRWSLITRSGR